MTDDDETPKLLRLAPGHVAAAAVVLWIATLLVGGPIVAASADRPGNPLSWARSAYLASNVVTLTGVRASWAQPTVAWAAAVTLVAQTCVFAFTVAAVLRLANAQLGSGAWAAIAFLPGAAWLALAGSGFVGPLDAAAALAGSGFVGEPASADGGRFWLRLAPVAIIAGLTPFAIARLLAGRAAGPQLRLVAVSVASLFAAGLVATWPMGRAALAADVLAGGLTDAAATASAAGRWALVPLVLATGVRPTTLLVLVVGAASLTRGDGNRAVGVAIAWFAAFAALFAATFVSLIALLPERPADAVALLAAGAISNHALTAVAPDAAGGDAFVLAGAMVAGRLASMAALWWAVTRPGVRVAAVA